MTRRGRGATVWDAMVLVVLGCGSPAVPRWGVHSRAPHAKPDDVPVALTLPSDTQREASELSEQLRTIATLTGDQLLARHPQQFTGELDYDPRTAGNLSLIQASRHALDDAALRKLAANGFVIDPKQTFASMGYGYRSIYAHDLPVYVSLDSILDSVHLSYDAILRTVERDGLMTDLATLLEGVRDGLPSLAASDPEVAKDLDLYSTVALSLLNGRVEEPAVGADIVAIEALVAGANRAEGIVSVTLFGWPRSVDFSQMKPRGHYAGDEKLERYFRAMMWLGRTDFRLIETTNSGERVLRTRQLAAVIALRGLVVGQAREAYDRIDAVVTAFVGQHDYMHLAQVDALIDDLDLDAPNELYTVEPEAIAKTIIAGGYGAQRVASQVMFKHPGAGSESLPLDRSFALLGQRYVADAHVFSEVVFDRVAPTQHGERVLPDPLDAAYAALGNTSALPLLGAELTRHQYAPQLESMRVLFDAHDASFWKENLYNRWLSTLRTLSPRDTPNPDAPSVTRTEAWSRRMLNTQLGSWAQLRHDTILYAKQSYSTGVECEFPDAYVDPYPEAFAELVRYAAHGVKLSKTLRDGLPSELAGRVRSYFEELGSVAAILQEMAEHQRAGTPFNETQLAFINDLVDVREGAACGPPPRYVGWYARLLFENDPDEMSPVIADVHTFPGGDRPPQVLHVATGLPRFMVVTVNTCNGPRAYVGLAFAYHEVVTGLDRLTDRTWAPMAADARDVSWMQAVLP